MHQEAYNLQRADQLASYAALVMSRPETIATVAADLDDAKLLAWIESHDSGTQGALIETPNEFIYVFRGTEIDLSRPRESYKDIKTDLMFRTEKFQGAPVHRGFLRAYRSIESELEASLKYLTDHKPVFLTGHSLGGAIAQMCAIRMGGEGISAVYTFGSPRVGGAKVDQLASMSLYQFIHAADLVPRVPLMLMGFRTAGDKRYIKRNGQIVRSPTIFRTAGRFFWTLVTRPSYVIRDHSMEHYQRAIKMANSGS